MTGMKKISFILPCYNVERYVADCLNSIYAQDLSEDEYEVICVNDCSTDSTREVIARFAKQHSNLTLIDHKKNLTAGGARNTGIDVAQGEYIWFVDPDDAIKSEKVSGLYEEAHEAQLDILMFNFDFVDENLKFIQPEKLFADSEVMTGQDYVLTFFPGSFSKLCIIWRCLFRTGFLKENVLGFPHMRKAQDVVFVWKTMLLALRVKSLDEIAYLYRVNPYSVGGTKLNAVAFFSERILFASEIVKMLEDSRSIINEKICVDMEKTARWCVNSNLSTLKKLPEEELGNYYCEIVKHGSEVKKVKPYMSRKNRLLYTSFGGRRFWLLKVRLLKQK